MNIINWTAIVVLGYLAMGCGSAVQQNLCFKASEYKGCSSSVFLFEGSPGDSLYVCKSIGEWKELAGTNQEVQDNIVSEFNNRCN